MRLLHLALRRCAAVLALATLSASPLVAQAKLQRVDLPAGLVKGVKIGRPNTYPRAEIHRANPKKSGFSGISLVGQGMGTTFVDLGDWGASILIGDDCGRVEIRNCTVIGARDFGIKYQGARGDWYVRRVQVDSDGDGELDDWVVAKDENGDTIQDYKVLRTEHTPDALLVLRNVRLVTGDFETKFLVHTTNVDHFWENVHVDAEETREHALYAHGFARRGIYWVNVFVEGIGAEACKVATRPWEAFFAEGAGLTMDKCRIQNFGQPGANWQDGGCGIFQGSGLAYIDIRRSIFQGREGTDGDGVAKETLVSLSNGLSDKQNRENNRRRFYDVKTGLEAGDMPPGGAANGHVRIDRCAFLGFGRKKVMQTQSLYPNSEEDFGIAPHFIVQSWTMTNCVGVDGGGPDTSALMTLRFVEGDNVTIRGCNTPELLRYAEEALQWNFRDESGRAREIIAHTPKGNGPLSEDRE